MLPATDRHHLLHVVALWVLALFCLQPATASELSTVDALLSESSKYLYASPEKALVPLEKLSALQAGFTPEQNERYHLTLASSLGFRARHAERVALVQSFIGQVKTPGRRASFLYELIDGYTALGQYELALEALNESIALLPLLEKTGDKITVLQAAIAAANVFEDYAVALEFADRIYALRGDDKPGTYAACVGLTDMVEIQFLRGARAQARAMLKAAIDACKTNKNPYFILINKSNAALDQIDTGAARAGIASALPLLGEHATVNQGSDYVAQLEEAVARAYLQIGNTERAEHYGLQAYQRAQSSHILAMQAKTSKTMAKVMRAKGLLSRALVYNDIQLAMHKRQQDDQLQKRLAYQRVRFDAQDQANQLLLLQQKNKNLDAEKALQQGRNHKLFLFIGLGVVVLAILAAWLRKTLKMKNILRLSSQVDGLTQVSSRAHFITAAHRAFVGSGRAASLVLFDMDLFKTINDTYGHATGDWVLKTVCDTVKHQLPKRSLFGRLGGEEFAICLPLLSASEATAVAQRCRVAIANIGAHPSGLNLEITASFGVATRSVQGPISFEETLAAADKALYVSKNEGRDRVTTYQHLGTLQT